MSQIVGFATLEKTSLSRHARKRMTQRSSFRAKGLRKLMDERRFVELSVDKPKRVVLVYSKADRYCYVVIENFVTKRIVTMMALWQFRESTLTSSSSDALKARQLALGELDPPPLAPPPPVKPAKVKVRRPLNSMFKPRVVQVYNTAAPDPEVELHLARYRQKLEERQTQARAEQAERIFHRDEHTVIAPWDMRFFAAQTSWEAHFLTRLKLHSGLTQWEHAPAFEVGVRLEGESEELKGKLLKAYFREPLLSVIQTEIFRRAILKALEKAGRALREVRELAVWVGPKRYALDTSERDDVLEGCHRMLKDVVDAVN